MAEPKSRQCPDCHVNMVPGRRRDKGDSFAVAQERWLPGEPVPETLGWTSGFGESVLVTTFACPQCGLLLLYIDPESLDDA